MTKIIGAGGPSDRASIPLATRHGSFIPNERRREKHPEQLKASIELLDRELPAAKLRSATALYNCMGLVFASRRTWVDTGELETILLEDDYKRLAGPDGARIGDVVVYGREDEVRHVGVIVGTQVNLMTGSREISVMSKWGADGEYIHELDYVPALLGRPSAFWTDRRSVL